MLSLEWPWFPNAWVFETMVFVLADKVLWALLWLLLRGKLGIRLVKHKLQTPHFYRPYQDLASKYEIIIPCSLLCKIYTSQNLCCIFTSGWSHRRQHDQHWFHFLICWKVSSESLQMFLHAHYLTSKYYHWRIRCPEPLQRLQIFVRSLILKPLC